MSVKRLYTKLFFSYGNRNTGDHVNNVCKTIRISVIILVHFWSNLQTHFYSNRTNNSSINIKLDVALDVTPKHRLVISLDDRRAVHE